MKENEIQISIYDIFNQYKYLGINRIFNSFYSRADNFVISQLLNLKDLASYGVSMIFYRNFGLLSNSLATVYLPKYGTSFKQNNEQEIFHESLTASFITGLISGLFVYAISETAVRLLWGNSYTDAVILIKIFSFGIPFLFIRTTAGYFLNFMGKTKVNMILSICSFLISMILNILLIPDFGIVISAVIAVTVSIINVGIMLAVIFKYLHSIICKNNQ